jgi:hypothetical protein
MGRVRGSQLNRRSNGSATAMEHQRAGNELRTFIGIKESDEGGF